MRESLADLADRLLVEGGADETRQHELDREDERLHLTVELLARVRPEPQSSGEMKARIRSRVIEEWRTHGPRAAGRTRLWHSSRQIRRFYTVGAILTAFAVMVIGLLLARGPIAGLPAGAKDSAIGMAAALAAILLFLASIFWWSRRKHK